MQNPVQQGSSFDIFDKIIHIKYLASRFSLEFSVQDVGQAILESYSRVLESLAFKIVSWIGDVLYIDGSVKKP